MKTLQLTYQSGIYFAPIDISIEEWKHLLTDRTVFDEESLKMVIDWYNQPFHQATAKEVMTSNNITGGTPYNGVVVGLGKRIVKYLNKFEVLNTQGSGKSYFIIPFEGWHVDYNPNKEFVWKVRDELIIALEELNLVVSPARENEIDSLAAKGDTEGKVTSFYSRRYERSTKNRSEAIRLHGTVCYICGFDFEKMYGVHGKGFIEVHHIHPLSEQQKELEVDPKTDLICVCANCHRMIHRMKHDTLSPDRLKQIVSENRKTLLE